MRETLFDTEAIKAFCELPAKNLSVERFIIRPSKRNARAVRAYEKAGFVKVSEEDKQKVVKDFLRDEYLDIYGQEDYGIGDDIVLIRT